MEALSFQHLMDQLGELSGSQRQVLSEAIALGGSGEELLEMINTRFKAAPVCGHCGSTQVRKWGKASGLKRYLCQKCRRTFNALTPRTSAVRSTNKYIRNADHLTAPQGREFLCVQFKHLTLHKVKNVLSLSLFSRRPVALINKLKAHLYVGIPT